MLSSIPLPAHVTKDYDAVAPGVFGLRVVMVNVFAVAGPAGSWVLVDAGLYFAAKRIRRWAESHFGPGKKPTCIILTHGHFDHVGSLRELADEWDVPVYAHPLEQPYLDGRSSYPPPDPSVGGGAMALLSPLYPRRPINVSDRLRTLPEDGSVPGLPGWNWIHTPGHTHGHVSLFRAEDRTLIAGDAFITTRQEALTAVLAQTSEMHGPPAYYTSDWVTAGDSVRRLALLEPDVLATGHGLPVAGPQATAALHRLAHEFNQIAVPSSGRYVHAPALADGAGVISLPPSVANPWTKVLVAGAVVGAVYLAVGRRRRL